MRLALLVLAGCAPAVDARPCPEAAAPQPCPGCAAAPAASGAAPGAPLEGMVRVPAGVFLRGSPESVGLEDEHPQRKIYLDAFDIDRTEVSVAAYAACVEAKACSAPACEHDEDEPDSRADHPVVCVPWADADKFCRFARKRLPTEAEWEKAARGVDGAPYPWGELAPSCKRANYDECGLERRPVGSLPAGASPFGALDMAGNVYEWVADWHHSDYYAISPEKNPDGPWSGEKKVVRGGAYNYDADQLSAHGRTFDVPEKALTQVGLRCARSTQ